MMAPISGHTQKKERERDFLLSRSRNTWLAIESGGEERDQESGEERESGFVGTCFSDHDGRKGREREREKRD